MDENKTKCSNILHIIKLLLTTRYPNAKLEKMFNVIDWVKTHWRNRM